MGDKGAGFGIKDSYFKNDHRAALVIGEDKDIGIGPKGVELGYGKINIQLSDGVGNLRAHER